jgi:hypothetical protein
MVEFIIPVAVRNDSARSYEVERGVEMRTAR